ncbi:MAG: ATP-binding protein [Streptosporangiaceae bacterium]
MTNDTLEGRFLDAQGHRSPHRRMAVRPCGHMRAREAWGGSVGQIVDHDFAALLDAVPDALVCVDAGGRIVSANDLAGRLFGYARGELVGQPVEVLVPDAFRAARRRHRPGDAASPPSRPMSARMTLTGRRCDGGTFPAEISLSAADVGEGVVVIVVIRDVSERPGESGREGLVSQGGLSGLEREVYQAQRLESLGQLAAGMAHDFNDLLGAILGYASFVREEVAKEEPQIRWSAVREDIREVERAAQRATVLTRRLLAFAHKQMANPRALHINDVVRDLQGLLVHTLGEPVELVTVLGQDLGPVLADKGQIEQVLLNLTVNARDAMPWGGKLTIETSKVAVDRVYAAAKVDLAPGDYVCLEFADTGKGIPAAILDRVFEPFFTTKPEGPGTGLGLAMVYGIVRQAQGHITISSEPGNGTTVKVLLPITESATGPAKALADQEPGGGSGEVVLLVEGDAAMREVTRRMLHGNGYQVLTAAGGKEAIDIATNRHERIDLLLTDVLIPPMQGGEVADRIRALVPGIRVLFMSASSWGLLGAKGTIEPGANLIEKPFLKPALMQKVREVLAPPTGPDSR